MRKTRSFFIGQTPIGGGAPVTVQSMTNTDSRDAQATLAQVQALAAAGCDIVRLRRAGNASGNRVSQQHVF